MTERQASYLMDILDAWQEQHEEVRHDLESAEPFGDVEDMLMALDNFAIMERDTVSLREQVYIALRRKGAL